MNVLKNVLPRISSTPKANNYSNVLEYLDFIIFIKDIGYYTDTTIIM